MAAQKLRIDLIVAQNDAMGMGAKKAIEESSEAERERWRGVPIFGCDGVASTGQALVRTGQLTATVITPANTGEAMKLMVKAMRGGAAAPAHTLMTPTPFPAIEKLTPQPSRG
jgi:ABC-type sugar transport system substrate-binding protein